MSATESESWLTAEQMIETILRSYYDKHRLAQAIYDVVPMDPAYVARRGHGKVYSPAAVALIRSELRRRNIEVKP